MTIFSHCSTSSEEPCTSALPACDKTDMTEIGLQSTFTTGKRLNECQHRTAAHWPAKQFPGTSKLIARHQIAKGMIALSRSLLFHIEQNMLKPNKG